jgi:endoglucanase
MDVKQERALGYLSRLGSQPATSFYESGVAATIKSILAEVGVDYRVDDYGNIIARLAGQAGSSDTVPPIAFVAHMDHPGFEAVSVDGGYLVGKAAGGVPAASFEAGVPLQIILQDGRRLPAATAGRCGNEADRQVLIQLGAPQLVSMPSISLPSISLPSISLPCSVVFDLVDFQLDGEFIRMRALDDLAGCGSILAALTALSQQPAPGDVYGVFTRAEEVGLVGARVMGEARTLPDKTLVVSLESSRALPGAEIGGGPVVRVGDAGFTFNVDAESALIKARETLQARPEGLRVQRQLMSGGVCEASAFALYGYRTTGIAFPLGNYHNGTPEDGIGAEYIHLDDFMGGIELIVEASRRVPERGDTAFRRRLGDLSEELRSRLLGS